MYNNKDKYSIFSQSAILKTFEFFFFILFKCQPVLTQSLVLRIIDNFQDCLLRNKQQTITTKKSAKTKNFSAPNKMNKNTALGAGYYDS